MALFPLNIITEILINGTWIDVTKYVYQRDTITITGGSTSTGDTPQPSSATITFNNRDGRFSPLYSGGAWYPYLARNTQVRISVNDTSSSGNVYNGFRFWGQVPDWPPLQDLSGKDIYVQVTATGPLRAINTGGGEGSALQRYYSNLTGSYAPVAYWPCEEEAGAGVIGSGVQGGSNMTVVSGSPTFKAVSKFNGSSPIGVVNKSTWTGVTSAFGSSGDDLYIAAGTYQWIATTTTVNCKCIGGGGGATKGSEGNGGGPGGAGGEFAQEATLAVTPGQVYSLTVGAGGSPGNWNAGGSDGADSTFTGDAVTVNANGGSGAGSNGGGTAAGGTGSSNTVHHNGGAGGGVPGSATGGGGGGGSGGTSSAGNAGANSSTGTGGAGGSAVTGGGHGGNGGSNTPSDGAPGGDPGGGGGGGWANNNNHTLGGAGAPGSVELVYTGSGGGTQPNNNVIRFVMWTPAWGGNNGKVILRVLGSGTVAKMDVQYITGGNIRLFGYNAGATQIFDSGNLAVGTDNQTLMVSAELAKSGTSVAWAFSAIVPGANGVVAKTSGSVASSSMGSVSQVIVCPNSDITKTAIGHISVQYALIPLYQVSQALDGHDQEVGIDRFLRLATEQSLGAIAEHSEAADHWGFEGTTQSWAGTNVALTSSTTKVTGIWPTDGTHSLLLTNNATGLPSATSPTGTGGQPIIAGDNVTAAVDMYVPVAITTGFIKITFYTGAGASISSVSSANTPIVAGTMLTLQVDATAPATAAFFAVSAGDATSHASSFQIYIDNVRVSPQMGPQATKKYASFLTEIKDLDQGIMKEAKTLWGLAYRTRIAVINQSADVTLDYAQKMLSPPLAPVVDTLNVKNDITVKRKAGSKVQVTLSNGSMSILEPPQGTGRFKKTLTAVAAADEQLAALAAQLLLVGTVSDERYPTITVDLARCGITGNPLAPLMSAIAGVEVGDVVQLNNLPFFYPSATTKQLVIGYTETLNAYEWTITWNCQPYSPYVVVSTNLRRW